MTADPRAAAAADRAVLIPSYNTGARLFATVAAARRAWPAVIVVIDGSTDGTGAALAERYRDDDAVRVIRRGQNGGKGAAVRTGLRAALAAGVSHVLVMDADGQHPAGEIAAFMTESARHPAAMILGVPVFGAEAPMLRVIGRKVSNALAAVETLGAVKDSLFGFRVYPVAELLAVMAASRGLRGFDFDPGAAVRLSWRGVAAINRPAQVRYFRKDEGGVSHFRYVRDNLRLAAMHAELMLEFCARLPALVARRFRSSRH